jgi:hypothetical protein
MVFEIPKSGTKDDEASDSADGTLDVPKENFSAKKIYTNSQINLKYASSLDHLLLIYSSELEDYKEIIESSDAVKWEQAMKEEFRFLEKNKIWDLTELPKEKALFNYLSLNYFLQGLSM